jgi:undecaprenyl-diphosphatase
MEWYEALIFGLVQGLTEFLPVSSSGHLEILKYFFGGINDGFLFTVAVHGATVLSVLVVFWPEISQLFRGAIQFKMNTETDYILKIIVSMIPVIIVGFTLKDFVESFFNGNMIFIGVMLIVTSLFLAISHFIKKDVKNISYGGAFIIGIVQAFAVLPGLSRSGSTISTGLMLGIKKEDITRFSFLMVIVPVLGSSFVELLSVERGGMDFVFVPLTIAFVTAFVAGYFACRWMISIVNKGKLYWFAIYCALLGASLIFFTK